MALKKCLIVCIASSHHAGLCLSHGRRHHRYAHGKCALTMLGPTMLLHPVVEGITKMRSCTHA